MWACLSDFKLKMVSLLFILFGVAVANVSNNAPPSLFTCIDWECEEWISQGVTKLRYFGKTEKHLSFQKNQKIDIISKPVNKDLPDWVGKMGNKIGLVPREMVREDRINKNPTKFKLDLQEILDLHRETGPGEEEDDELEDEESSNEVDGVEIEDVDDDLKTDESEIPPEEKQETPTPLEEATPVESVPLQTTEALPPPTPNDTDPPPTTSATDENSKSDELEPVQVTEVKIDPTIPSEISSTIQEEDQKQENENAEPLPQESQQTVLPTLASIVIPEQSISSEGDHTQNEVEEVTNDNSNQSSFSEQAEEILNQAPFVSSAVPVELGTTVNLQPSTDTVLQGSSTILDDYYLTETPNTAAMEEQQNVTRVEDQVTPRIPETVLLGAMTSILENQIASSSSEPEGTIVATRVEKSESVVSSIPEEEETQFVLTQAEEKTKEPLADSSAAISGQQELKEAVPEDSENSLPVDEAQTLSPEKVETVQPHKLSDGDEKVENTTESKSLDDNGTTTSEIETPSSPLQEMVNKILRPAETSEAKIPVDSNNDATKETAAYIELQSRESGDVANQEDSNDEKEIADESSTPLAPIETFDNDNVESSTATTTSVEEKVEETVTNATPTHQDSVPSDDEGKSIPVSSTPNVTDTEEATEEQSVEQQSNVSVEEPTVVEQKPAVQDQSALEQETSAAEPEPAVVDEETTIVEENPTDVEQQENAATSEDAGISDPEPSSVVQQEDNQQEDVTVTSTESPEVPEEEKVDDLPKESDSTTEATAVLDEQVVDEPTVSTPSSEAVDQDLELKQEAVTPVPQETQAPEVNANSDSVTVNTTLSESESSQSTGTQKAEMESMVPVDTQIPEDRPADNLSETITPIVSVVEDSLPQTAEPEVPVSTTILTETQPSPSEIPQPLIEIVSITPPPPVISPEKIDVNPEETKPSENESVADLLTPTSTELPVAKQPLDTVAIKDDQVEEDLQQPQEQEKHSNEDTSTDHHDHHHHGRHHHRHRHFGKGSWNDSSSSSIIVVIKHLSSTLLSFLPEALQDTILDVDDALVFTGIIALTLVSICVPYFFIEGYMSVRPLKKKVVELNKSLWKVSAAYETQQEEFEIFKRKAIAHDEYRKRAEQSENDVIILKTLEQKHREQIQALKTQLKSQIKEARDIRALIEKTLKDKKAVEEESAKYKATAEKASQDLVKAKDELANFQTHVKSTTLQLGMSSKNKEVMSSKITMLEQETEHLKSQLTGESEKRKALAEEMNLVNQSKTELEKELTEVKKICVQYEGTVDSLNNDIYKLESELATIKETLGEDSPLIEIAEVQARAEFSEKEAESLRTRLDCVCADNDTLRGKLEETSVALEETRSERDAISKKLTVLEKYWTEREEEQLKTIENLTEKFNLRDRGRDELIEMIEQKEKELHERNETLESLREEMEEQSAKHRNEVRTLEAKGHENWLSLCQAERKAQDARKDAEMLRQRLTAMVKEKERSEAQDECDDDDSDGLSGQFPMVFPNVIPHELVPPPILDLDDEEEPPSYFGLGDFVPPPPLPDDDDDADGEGGRLGEPRRRPPPLGGTRLSPSLSDYTDDDEDDEDEDNNNILSPIRRREEEGCTDGSSGSGSGSPPVRGGGWINLPVQRGGSAGMRRLPGSSSSRATSSPVQPGANL